jgi:hypothetical protein
VNETELFDALMAHFETGYDEQRNRVKQEDLDKQKIAADEGALIPARSGSPSSLEVRRPAVGPASDSRQGKKLARAEQERQWRIAQTAQRTALAVNSMIAVTVHGQNQLDKAQEVMTDCFYATKRRPEMNEFMARVTSRCLSMAESGVMAILESHPKRTGEDL